MNPRAFWRVAESCDSSAFYVAPERLLLSWELDSLTCLHIELRKMTLCHFC